ncbi:MAG: hypothetical protein ACLP5E_24065 [Streptosporangiaceae bacterium]
MTDTGAGRGSWVDEALREHEEHAGREHEEHARPQHGRPGHGAASDR